MFFHLADKLYVTNLLSMPTKESDGITRIYYYADTFKEDLEIYPTFSHYVKAMIERYVKNREVTLLCTEEWILQELMSLWCGRLNLGKNGFQKLIEHANFCETYVEDAQSTIGYTFNSEILHYQPKKREKIRFKKIWPAELCINQLNEDWVREKYEYFRMYDLYARIKENQYALYRNGTIKESPIKENDQSIKDLYNDVDFLKTISAEIDLSFLSMDIEDYVMKNPTFGYNRFNTWKFNWALAHYVRDTGYKIGEGLLK